MAIGISTRDIGRLWARLNPYVTLVIASLSALVLVGVIGLLMAFVQYQARLLSSLPGMTGGQLLEFVAAERDSVDTAKKMKDSAEKISKTEDQIRNTIFESNYKIEVICSIFKKYSDDQQPSATKPVGKCVEFLQSVPFDGTLVAQSGASLAAPPPTPAESAPEERIIDAISSNFIAVMQSEVPPSTDVKNITPLLKRDILSIASLNKKLRINIRATYENEIQAYNSNCRIFNNLRDSISYRRLSSRSCSLILPLAFPQTDSASIAKANAGEQATGSGSEAPSSMLISTSLGQPGPPPTPGGAGPALAEQQRNFELVSHYMFYSSFGIAILDKLLLSPGDYLALWLVSLCGALGGFINILFLNQTTGSDPTFKRLLIDPVQGIVCALIVYILLRSGFIAVADAERFKDVSTISPFFIAFVGVAAGLLASRAIESFRDLASSWFGRVQDTKGDQWAVGLADAIATKATDANTLAKVIGVDAAAMERWIAQTEIVPATHHRVIAVALGVDERKLFTPIAP